MTGEEIQPHVVDIQAITNQKKYRFTVGAQLTCSHSTRLAHDLLLGCEHLTTSVPGQWFGHYLLSFHMEQGQYGELYYLVCKPSMGQYHTQGVSFLQEKFPDPIATMMVRMILNMTVVYPPSWMFVFDDNTVSSSIPLHSFSPFVVYAGAWPPISIAFVSSPHAFLDWNFLSFLLSSPHPSPSPCCCQLEAFTPFFSFFPRRPWPKAYCLQTRRLAPPLRP